MWAMIYSMPCFHFNKQNSIKNKKKAKTPGDV